MSNENSTGYNSSSIPWIEINLSSSKMDEILSTLVDLQSNFDCCLSGKNETGKEKIELPHSIENSLILKTSSPFF